MLKDHRCPAPCGFCKGWESRIKELNQARRDLGVPPFPQKARKEWGPLWDKLQANTVALALSHHFREFIQIDVSAGRDGYYLASAGSA